MSAVVTDAESWYVYGVVPRESALQDELAGVDGQPVELVPCGTLAAVVSHLNVDRTIGRRADLLAHSRVLDAVAAHGPVIPVQFGSLLESTADLQERVLEPGAERLESLLAALAGRSQFTVSARYDEEQLLAEVVAENPEVAELRARTRDVPEDAMINARIRLGELVMRAAEAKRSADGEKLFATLSPYLAAHNLREGAGLDHLIDLACLVEDEQRQAFEDAAEQAATALAGRARVRLLGPTAPYDFVPAGGEGWG
jgi:hypothetical protein